MEELLLETSEEPLCGRVVRTGAFLACRPGRVVLLADTDPSGPPAVASPDRADDRRFALGELSFDAPIHCQGFRRVGLVGSGW